MIIFGLVGFGEFSLTLSGALKIFLQWGYAHVHEQFFFFPTGAIHELYHFMKIRLRLRDTDWSVETTKIISLRGKFFENFRQNILHRFSFIL